MRSESNPTTCNFSKGLLPGEELRKSGSKVATPLPKPAAVYPRAILWPLSLLCRSFSARNLNPGSKSEHVVFPVELRQPTTTDQPQSLSEEIEFPLLGIAFLWSIGKTLVSSLAGRQVIYFQHHMVL